MEKSGHILEVFRVPVKKVTYLATDLVGREEGLKISGWVAGSVAGLPIE